jgi:DNA-binding transcriptional LysR family regulator
LAPQNRKFRASHFQSGPLWLGSDDMKLLLDSRSLEVFLAVCDAGSMTGAAKRLGITQGAVSQQINRLETSLELKLLARDSRDLRLLPAGLHLRHHARRVFDEIRDAENSMQRFRGFSFPSLSVGLMETLGEVLAGTVVTTCENLVENLQVRASVTYRHREDIASGEVDMLISADPFDETEFEIHPIASEPIILVLPKAYIDKEALDLEVLGGSLPFIRLGAQRRLAHMADKYLAQHLVMPVRSIELDQASLVIDAVRRGQGWAITTPFGLLHAGLTGADVDAYLLPPPVPFREIKLITKRDRFAGLPAALAHNCRTFLKDQIVHRLSELAPRITPAVLVHESPLLKS